MIATARMTWDTWGGEGGGDVTFGVERRAGAAADT